MTHSNGSGFLVGAPSNDRRGRTDRLCYFVNARPCANSPVLLMCPISTVIAGHPIGEEIVDTGALHDAFPTAGKLERIALP
jgi:hypothetical protein